MAHVEYAILLAGGWLSLLWVDLQFGTGIVRCWRRLLCVQVVCLALFLSWDSLGVHRGYWRSEPGRVLGLWVLPGVPVEEAALLAMVTYAALVLWTLSRTGRRRPSPPRAERRR